MEKKKRNNEVKVRLNEAEEQALKEQAAKLGIPPAKLAYNLLKGELEKLAGKGGA